MSVLASKWNFIVVNSPELLIKLRVTDQNSVLRTWLLVKKEGNVHGTRAGFSTITWPILETNKQKSFSFVFWEI